MPFFVKLLAEQEYNLKADDATLLKALRDFCFSLALCSLKGRHFLKQFFVLNTKDSHGFTPPVSVNVTFLKMLVSLGLRAFSFMAAQHAYKVISKRVHKVCGGLLL